MKRPTITIEEFIAMPVEELDAFIERDRQLFAQGLVSKDAPNVNMIDMTLEQFAEKYHLKTLDELLDNII